MLKLEEIINGFMLQHELPDSSFGRVQSLAIRGYRQLHYHSIGGPVTETVDVNGDQTATMPCDLLTVLGIGVVNGRGEMSQLTEDTSLVLADSPSRRHDPHITDDLNFTNIDYLYADPIGSLTYPGFFQQQYGTGSKSDLGFYRLDWKARQVVFDYGITYKSLEIEYLPIAKDDGVYLVHPLFQEALIGFISWQHMVGNRKYNGNDRADAERYYNNQLRIARRATNPFDPAEIYNQYYRTTRLARF